MQAPSLQEINWPVVALEALKYLGPAILVLIGSLFAQRQQRLLRQKELDAGARLRARELVFNHHQKKLDKLSAASDDLSKSLGEMQALMHSPETGDPVAAATKFLSSFISITLMAKHEAEGMEDELKAFGLREQYANELGVLNEMIAAGGWQPQGTLEQQADEARTLLLSLVLIQEALLEARMRDLFSEYLPARRTLKLNT
jgi:hypothetical protein